MPECAASDPPPPVSPALDFFAGTVAGIASLLTGHPFDTVKVRLQTQDTSKAGRGGAERYYRNAFHAFARVAKEEKLSGLYKGVLGIALMNASVFTSYKFAMTSLLPSPDAEPTLAQITLAGSASGIFTSLLTTPIERLKILQQSSSVGASARLTPSFLSLVRTLPLRELYRGFLPTLLRDTAYGPYFLVYEYVVRGGDFGLSSLSWFGGGGGGEGERRRRHVKADLVDEVESELFGSVDAEGKREEGAGAVRVLIAGGLAGIAGWGATFPIDVLKTRIQSVPYPLRPSSSASPHPYSTLRSTFGATLRDSGWRGFVAGLGPTLVRSVPVNMVTFAVFELVVSTFR
ncbi:hypothetical protein JCM6882_000448 [Rhodosporidiobolus microsporus]